MAVEHGYLPLGKYSSARDDILHYMCMSDWANYSDGNSEAPTGYFWAIANTPEDVQTSNTEFSSLLEEWLKDNPEVTDSPALRAELVGRFIVIENSQGFVSVASGYASDEELQMAYQQLEDEYSAWDEEE